MVCKYDITIITESIVTLIENIYNTINLIIIEKSHRQRQKFFLISINGKSNIFIKISHLQNFIYYQIT